MDNLVADWNAAYDAAYEAVIKAHSRNTTNSGKGE
jgi:hypothetical protein